MATREENVAELKTLTGQDIPDSIDAKTVEKLLGLAKKSLADFETQYQELTAEKIKVITGDKAKGSFMHPISKQWIRQGDTKPVELPDDAWTQDMIAQRFLKEVRK
ncbi:hypothetical protein [Deinococcus cellulosilyticus]|uniref:Uncharacterized protein n=1 Tax=Deinococcus cellulosilyticus (strain DSM 18568 / NBRC 106333 / KACC 11606 / 5516J-15) TaxID=1223518 RepID=A0A511N0F5_DEIC1|nr:hypothetical protein [Deinococcus cellulosilyticus]GEM45907.1 hypothetical protein DC3_15420 [Deinococcus cellulosilyticus NBRC 106333 = KACC 11606]